MITSSSWFLKKKVKPIFEEPLQCQNTWNGTPKTLQKALTNYQGELLNVVSDSEELFFILIVFKPLSF